MNAEIIHFNPIDEFETPERCFITEQLNRETDPDLSIARARVDPDVTTAWHKLADTDERYLIVSGTGRMELEGHEPADVVGGDIVCIPANAAQRITNTGTDDLIFFAICTPRFTPASYIELE